MNKQVTYKDSEYDVTFVVHSCNIRDGLTMSLLERKAQETAKGFVSLLTEASSAEIAVLLWAYQHMYPMCMAVSHSFVNGPDATKILNSRLTPEEFVDLPMELGSDWLEAVYEVNPQWRPSAEDEEEPEPGESQEPSENASDS
jgi:hypothetical protein